MKKGVIFGTVAGGMLLALTGCGKEQVLSCILEQDQTGMHLAMEMNVTFQNEENKSLTMTTQVDLEEDYTDYVDTLAESFEDQYATYKENGMDVDVQTSDSSVTAILEADFNQISDEEKEELGFSPSDNDYDAVKETLESSGFTCK